MYRKKQEHIKYSNKLVCHLMFSLLLYTILGWILRILLDFYSDQIDESFIKWLTLRIGIAQFLYLIIGYIVIFMHFWKKPWKYLHEIINGTEIIYKKNDSVVELSEPLKDIEVQMNQIKMAVIMADQEIKVAESKKNELVAYIAHDIRTPLTSIIGYLSLLKDMPELSQEKRQKYLQTLLDRAMRLERLVDDFFEITQYNTEQIAINKQKVDLYYLIIQLTDEFYPMLEEKGNILRLELSEPLSCDVDPEKISRALSNLLKNAICYSYPKTEIAISAKIYDDWLEMVFENMGETIPENELSQMFEKFHRLDRSRTPDTGGAGLGLSIAREIIRLHNGEITAQSQNNKIRFLIKIPI